MNIISDGFEINRADFDTDELREAPVNIPGDFNNIPEHLTRDISLSESQQIAVRKEAAEQFDGVEPWQIDIQETDEGLEVGPYQRLAERVVFDELPISRGEIPAVGIIGDVASSLPVGGTVGQRDALGIITDGTTPRRASPTELVESIDLEEANRDDLAISLDTDRVEQAQERIKELRELQEDSPIEFGEEVSDDIGQAVSISETYGDASSVIRERRNATEELVESEGVEWTAAKGAVEEKVEQMDQTAGIPDAGLDFSAVEGTPEALSDSDGGPNRSLIALVAGVIGLLIIQRYS